MEESLVKEPGQPNPQIAIVGVGQLGSRYVQGLLSGSEPLDIWLQDPAINSMSEFETWKSTYSIDIGHHSVGFSPTSNELPDHFDLIISGTTADVRFESLNSFLERKTFNYLILEKLLTTGLDDLKNLTTLVQRGKGCWVNHARRLWPLYQQLKIELHEIDPMNIIVEGTDWNLASNSSHFCDLVRWLTDEELVSLDCSLIDSDWMESKRSGFVGFTGKLKYHFSQGSELVLESRRTSENDTVSPIKIRIRASLGDVVIDETAGTAQGSLLKGNLQGKSLYQSELTSDLVREILHTSQCALPKFEDVRDDHAIYLTELLDYQRNVHGNLLQTVRIT